MGTICVFNNDSVPDCSQYTQSRPPMISYTTCSYWSYLVVQTNTDHDGKTTLTGVATTESLCSLAQPSIPITAPSVPKQFPSNTAAFSPSAQPVETRPAGTEDSKHKGNEISPKAQAGIAIGAAILSALMLMTILRYRLAKKKAKAKEMLDYKIDVWNESIFSLHRASLSTLTYDDFGREYLRTITQGEMPLYSLTQRFDVGSRVRYRELRDGKKDLLRQESFEYDNTSRLFDYQCQGQQGPIDQAGRQLQHQHYCFTPIGGLDQVKTNFWDGSENIATYKKIDLKYDANGHIARDERGRWLEYDTAGYLTTVRDSERAILNQYHYDSHGRLVCQSVPGKPDYYLHYRGDRLIAATNGNAQISYLSDGHEYWGQILQESGQLVTMQLWVSDDNQSTLAWLNTNQPTQIHGQSYNPYGFCWYHLGNGSRAPDGWSPFIFGEINPYAYCLGDPINRLDPSGHFIIFGWEIGWRDFGQTIVGLALSGSVGSDFLFGAVGGAVGQGIAAGANQIVKSFRQTLDQLLKGADKLRTASRRLPLLPLELQPREVALKRLEGRLSAFNRKLLNLQNTLSPNRFAVFQRDLDSFETMVNKIRERQKSSWDWDQSHVKLKNRSLKGTQITKFNQFRFYIKHWFYSPKRQRRY
ncbi:hypothetical protein HD806DRAFT_526830 [Xylariaceae sp. AK1471]|nr:hypothetical protein HD806DRAFT_526830 [Xylariaceae sp. AK1471]